MPFSNILPTFRDGEDCGPKTIAKFHAQATKMVFSNGNKDLADFDQHGKEVKLEDIDFPFEV